MLTSLSISGFRGIPALKIDDLARVNIFLGGNGAGKTSILEALAAIANPVHPGMLATMSTWREMPGVNSVAPAGLEAFFYSMETSPIRLEFVVDGVTQRLTITALVGIEGTFEMDTDADSASSQSSTAAAEDQLVGVIYSYEPVIGDEPIVVEMRLMPQGYHTSNAKQVSHLGSFYIHARRATSSGETANLLTRLYERKADDLLVSALREVDPRLVRMHSGLQGNQPVIMVDVGGSRMVPMNVLGDGFCRCALIATGLLWGQAKLVIVDEIDSGLHHTVMRSVWENSLNLVRRYDRQLFCTTHDEEMLQATLDAFKDSPDDLRVFRIDRLQDGNVKAEPYRYEEFQRADELGMDIR